MSHKKLTAQQVSAQMMKGAFKSPNKIHQLADPIDDTYIELTLDQLQTYEHNPRKSKNPLYEEIKESIRNRGLDQPPTVTKRPNEKHYIIRNGGNTRLTILKELYVETNEEHFYKIKCLFKPWEGETATLVGHLVENELHGELMFIDKALAINHMRHIYSAEHKEKSDKPITLRDIADYLKRDGYPISHGLISRMLDCIDSLLPAIPNLLYEGLGKPRIEELLILRNAVRKVWNKYLENDLENFSGCWETALEKFNDIGIDNFNLIRVKDEVLAVLAFCTGQSYTTLELDLLDISKSSKSIPDNPTNSSLKAKSNIEAPPAPTSEPMVNTTIAPTTSQFNEPAPEKTSAAAFTQPRPTQYFENNSIDELSEKDQEQYINEHIVEPVTQSEKVQKINHEIDKQLGGEPISFKEAALKAIPVQAGGGLAEVTDIWYISKQIDTTEGLRSELYQLAYDLACHGNYQENIIQTNEGLGFGIQNQSVTNKNQHTQAIAMLLMTLLRLHPEQAQADISLAIVNQLLMGGYDIAIGHQTSSSIGIDRLPDALLIKFFRFIRLARRLVDLVKSDE